MDYANFCQIKCIDALTHRRAYERNRINKHIVTLYILKLPSETTRLYSYIKRGAQYLYSFKVNCDVVNLICI